MFLSICYLACLIAQAFSRICQPCHTIPPWDVALTKNKPFFLTPGPFSLSLSLSLPSLQLLLRSSDACVSCSLSSLSLSALPPPACHALICHIYNGNIQIYRCYQLITSALITIQLTSVSMRHAAGRPAPLPTQSHCSERDRQRDRAGGRVESRVRFNGRKTKSDGGERFCR